MNFRRVYIRERALSVAVYISDYKRAEYAVNFRLFDRYI